MIRIAMYFAMGCLLYYLWGCSWLSNGQYSTCKAEFSCDECKDLEIELFCEFAESADSKEAEVPGI